MILIWIDFDLTCFVYFSWKVTWQFTSWSVDRTRSTSQAPLLNGLVRNRTCHAHSFPGHAQYATTATRRAQTPGRQRLPHYANHHVPLHRVDQSGSTTIRMDRTIAIGKIAGRNRSRVGRGEASLPRVFGTQIDRSRNKTVGPRIVMVCQCMQLLTNLKKGGRTLTKPMAECRGMMFGRTVSQKRTLTLKLTMISKVQIGEGMNLNMKKFHLDLGRNRLQELSLRAKDRCH